jgi:cell division protein FtsB
MAVETLPPIPRRGERRRWRLDRALTLIASILLVNAIVGDRGLLETWRARRQFSALGHAVSSLRAENESLREQARQLREDPRRIEMIARRDLGLLRRGEILIVLRSSSAK